MPLPVFRNLATAFAVIYAGLAAAPVARQTATEIQVGNDALSISLDPNTGSLRSIIDRASGQSLIGTAPGYRALWGINLAPTGSETTGAFGDNNAAGRPAVALASSVDEASVTLTWSELRFGSAPPIPGAQVTVRIAINYNEPFARLSFAARRLGGITPAQVQFPNVAGVAGMGGAAADHRLLVPEQDGRLIADPITRRVNYGRTYPTAFHNLQFAAFYNPAGGFVLSARDTAGYTKGIQWFSPADQRDSAIWQVVHFVPEQPAEEVILPYETTLGVFHGDWTAAADQYRDWAWRQWWVEEAKKKPMPDWLRNLAFARQFSVNYATPTGVPDRYQSYEMLVEQDALARTYLGGSTLTSLWGWEKVGAWRYGDTFPPANGWASFDNAVRAVHAHGNHLHALFSGTYMDERVPLWQTEAARGAAMRDRRGNFIFVKNSIGAEQHTWYYMSPASAFWRKTVVESLTTLAQHGISSLQLDNWPFFDVQNDFSPGHPPGMGGNWQWLAWKQLLEEAVASLRAVRPGISLAAEQLHELALPYINWFNNRDHMAETMTYSDDGAPVPLFSYIYKPLIHAQTEYWNGVPSDQPDSYHRLTLARALVWGQRASLPNSPFLNDPRYSPVVLGYYRKTGAALMRFSRFLLEGTMLPPTPLNVPSTPVILVSDGAMRSYSSFAPSVQTATWRAASGEIGIVLTNISPNTLTVTIPVDFDRLKLRTGIAHAVAIDDTSSVRPAGAWSQTGSVDITLAPLEIRLLTIDVPPPEAGRLSNISVRTLAGTGDGTLIVGFSLGGGGTAKQLLVRAVGPTLDTFGVGGALSDPAVEIAPLGAARIAGNDNWAGADDLKAAFSAVGAFGFASEKTLDAAVLFSSPAGAYTAKVTGANNTTGVALVEVYDAGTGNAPRLINVSARSYVGVGSDALITGFVINGSAPKKVLIRASGPTLAAFGVNGTLVDPVLTIRPLNSEQVVGANDDWRGASTLKSAFAAVGAFGFADDTSKDAAVVCELEPGAYTATVSGQANGTGVALMEVYELP